MHTLVLEPSSLKRNVLQKVLNVCVHDAMPCSECTCLVGVWCYTAVVDWCKLALSTSGSSSSLLTERWLSVLSCHSNQQRLTWHLMKTTAVWAQDKIWLVHSSLTKSKNNKLLLCSASSEYGIFLVMQYASLCALHNHLLGSCQKTYSGFSSMNWGHCTAHTDHSHRWTAVATCWHAATWLKSHSGPLHAQT